MVMQRFLSVFFPDLLLPASPGMEPEERNLQDVIICATNDEVSMDLAHAWCDEDGLRLQIADHRDRWFPESIAGMVIDLNNLALRPPERARLVERLAKARLPYPVAIASYDLEPKMKDTLKARGILVFRRIDQRLFDGLGKAMKSSGIRALDAGHATRMVPASPAPAMAPASRMSQRRLLWPCPL